MTHVESRTLFVGGPRSGHYWEGPPLPEVQVPMRAAPSSVVEREPTSAQVFTYKRVGVRVPHLSNRLDYYYYVPKSIEEPMRYIWEQMERCFANYGASLTRASQLIEAVERELADDGVVCVLDGLDSILRILNVPAGRLVSVEDRAYEAAERLLAPGEDLPFAISSHLPSDTD